MKLALKAKETGQRFLGDTLAHHNLQHRIHVSAKLSLHHSQQKREFHSTPSGHLTSKVFLDPLTFKSVETCPTAPLHEKPFGRAKGSIVKRKPNLGPAEFYLVKTAFDLKNMAPCFDNIKIRGEQLNREIIAACMEPYVDEIAVPETFLVAEKPSQTTPNDEKDGYVHEWLASRIIPLSKYPTSEGKVCYSMFMQDFLRSKNYRPFCYAFLPFALIESWDHPGVFFSNVGQEKSTHKLVLLDFGVGSGLGQLGVPPFTRNGVLKTIDDMRYFNQNGVKVQDWDTLKISQIQERYGYYTHEVYPLDCARHIFQNHFSVAQCLKGIHLDKKRLNEIFDNVSVPVEMSFDEPQKQNALERYNESLKVRKDALLRTYTQRLDDINQFVAIVKFFYPEGQSDHQQLLPSAKLITEKYDELVKQLGEDGLKNVTPEAKGNITADLLRKSGIEQENLTYKYREKKAEQRRMPAVITASNALTV